MSEQAKYCPYRKDANGDFAPCYGEACMAYYEYDAPVGLCSINGPRPVGTAHVTACRMMGPVVPPVSCCV